jgi:CRISPR/Cas system CMR-associated protein Cmr3 (group 5 of RAMP superfamily)
LNILLLEIKKAPNSTTNWSFFMQCKECNTEFIPCKYNFKRQIFCTSKNCRQNRNIERSKSFRKKNPNYFKNDNARTAKYAPQKKEKRLIDKVAKATVREMERVFVDTSKTFANQFKNQLLTMIGMMSFYAGGSTQTSAFEAGQMLEKCYQFGVTLLESDPKIMKHLEKLYEKFCGFDKS